MIERVVLAIVKWLMRFLPDYHIRRNPKRRQKNEIETLKSQFDELAGE